MKRGGFLGALAAAIAATQVKVQTAFAKPPAAEKAFALGRTSQITLISPEGAVIPLGERFIGLDVAPQTWIREKPVSYDPSVPPDREVIYEGWTGNLRVGGRTRELDAFFDSEAMRYYASAQSGDYQPAYCTIVHTIVNENGEVDVYSYPNVALSCDSIEYGRDGKADAYALKFHSPERVYIGPAEIEA